jgi:hypothetical protein
MAGALVSPKDITLYLMPILSGEAIFYYHVPAQKFDYSMTEDQSWRTHSLHSSDPTSPQCWAMDIYSR